MVRFNYGFSFMPTARLDRLDVSGLCTPDIHIPAVVPETREIWKHVQLVLGFYEARVLA